MFVPPQPRGLSAFIHPPPSWAWEDGELEGRAVVTSQIHRLLPQGTGIAVRMCLPGPKQHWIYRNKIFAFLCCHLSCKASSLLLDMLHISTLLQTILSQPPASPFLGSTPGWGPKASRKAGAAGWSSAPSPPCHNSGC